MAINATAHTQARGSQARAVSLDTTGRRYQDSHTTDRADLTVVMHIHLSSLTWVTVAKAKQVEAFPGGLTSANPGLRTQHCLSIQGLPLPPPPGVLLVQATDSA